MYVCRSTLLGFRIGCLCNQKWRITAQIEQANTASRSCVSFHVSTYATLHIAPCTTATCIACTFFSSYTTNFICNVSKAIGGRSSYGMFQHVRQLWTFVTHTTLSFQAASGNVEEQSAMLYLDNVFPLRVGILDIRQWFFRNTMACMDRVLPSPELIPHGFRIKRIEPR